MDSAKNLTALPPQVFVADEFGLHAWRPEIYGIRVLNTDPKCVRFEVSTAEGEEVMQLTPQDARHLGRLFLQKADEVEAGICSDFERARSCMERRGISVPDKDWFIRSTSQNRLLQTGFFKRTVAFFFPPE